MGSLGSRSLRAALAGVAIILAVAALAGVVRLLPWLLAPEVPVEVALPFARALGASATETAFLLGVPIGFGLAASVFVERGESRALEALGASPMAITGSLVPHAVAVAVAALAAGLAWGSSADVPGRFAAELVRQGRASCTHARSPKSASVPLVGVAWLCFPDQPPRVSGPLPGAGAGAWFTARDLVPSDDLTSVELVDLRIAAELEGPRRLSLSAKQGVVRGLPGWGRSAKLPVIARGLLVSGTALLATLLAAWLVLSGHWVRRSGALLAGGLPAVSAFVALHRLDASSLGARAYALVPLSCLIAVALSAVVAQRVARRRAR